MRTTTSVAEAAASEVGATKAESVAARSNDDNQNISIAVNDSNSDDVEEWTVVNRKKTKYLNSEVKRGGCTRQSEISGLERKKYLHVWRLQKEVTEDNLQKHVKNIIGMNESVKVNRIKHKTERDYASFIIGVPESKYETLCNPENWAINIEYCEWIWFRSRSKSRSEVAP